MMNFGSHPQALGSCAALRARDLVRKERRGQMLGPPGIGVGGRRWRKRLKRAEAVLVYLNQAIRTREILRCFRVSKAGCGGSEHWSWSQADLALSPVLPLISHDALGKLLPIFDQFPPLLNWNDNAD